MRTLRRAAEVMEVVRATRFVLLPFSLIFSVSPVILVREEEAEKGKKGGRIIGHGRAPLNAGGPNLSSFKETRFNTTIILPNQFSLAGKRGRSREPSTGATSRGIGVARGPAFKH